MPNFRKLPTKTSCPDVDWFDNLPLPEGRTFICIGRKKLKLDQIITTNDKGQVVNIAREVGTSKENVQNIANNIKINGVLLDAQPPFVGTDDKLKDGFTRIEAIKSMQLESWVFNVVEPKENFTWSEVWDEIGLGANNHPPSKSATRGDFSTSLARWVVNQDEIPTQGQCIDWINNIPHSFSQEIVTNIAQKVLNNILASKTTENFDAKGVVKRVKQELPSADKKDVNVIPFNISGNYTYFKRAAFEVMESINNPNTKKTIAAAFVKDIPADKIEEVRKDGLKRVEEINELFESAFQHRMNKGKDFKLLNIDYFVPQVIDVETSLIPVETEV